VWRVTLRGGERVVVKQITDKGGAGSWRPAGAAEGVRGGSGEVSAEADGRFAREVAGLRAAGRALAGSGPVAPAVLEVDAAARVMVLEFVEDRGAPADWMPGFAAALARLHARGTAGDTAVLPAWRGPSGADVEAFLRFADALGVAVAGGVEDELAGMVRRVGRPVPDPAECGAAGRFGLLHGDPCPGNDLWTSDGVRFVDFEQAALGDGLVELAYLRIGFPTCWCAMAVPAAPAAEVEAVYRDSWRRATGRDVAGDAVDACAGWLVRGDALVERAHRESVDHLARAVAADFDWGYVSARERLAYRLGVVAELAGGGDRLGRFGRLCAELRERLVARWPGLRALPGPDSRPS
jgi:aminoglycoside phosphotransferase (APT) family kinase protein